ncbi:aldose 1-epimerase family protein [Marinomonas sp. M1K-6]|uniref:Aldose 1-epimerase family protein n=1 Tax=Marinomonas profundi TaxID=2726122 RepID=A0A847R3R4_9GAMM|nr:aldose 1-epimerase family protein [Marinomonas profundi]NLQ17033.1 aldose 1-epimerase family protein [Marinomonas profundi]UDV04765.1 aldose 1-epimerase family protein [Marinomonas profundi]
MFQLVLLSHQQQIDVGNLSLSAELMGLPKAIPISVQQTCLMGGKQAGSRLITLTVGDSVVRVVPTRGMAVLDVVRKDAARKDVRFGWDSPVKDVVHPSFINQEASGGLGWLDGFNEMVVRCGYQWAGHPGQDGDEFLTLHGRIQNTPADEVVLEVEQVPPYRVTLRGRVDEKRFKSTNFELQTALSLTPDEPYLLLEDTLTNKGSYPREYQAIYHNNFAQPILESGAQLHVPMAELSPFNDYAAGGLSDWNQMPAPTKAFDEMVFNIRPISDENGFSHALLHNANASCGIEVSYHTDTLPVLTVWKNTDTLEQGYVVGIEPGTSFAYNRAYQRDLGLVPTIAAGESKHFVVRFGLLTQAEQVNASVANIAQLQNSQTAQVLSTPIVRLG